MSKRNQRIFHLLNLILFSSVIIMSISAININSNLTTIKSSLNYEVENEWREQARRTTSILAEKLDRDISEGKVNVWDDTELNQWAVNNLLEIRNGGVTSDGFMINLGYSIRNWDDARWNELIMASNISPKVLTDLKNKFKPIDIKKMSNPQLDDLIIEKCKDTGEQFNTSYGDLIWLMRQVYFVKEKFILDGSPDCAKPDFVINGRYMSDEAKLHQNPELAEKALNEMRKAYNTNIGDSNYWQFDDAEEWLEWSVLPRDSFGFAREGITVSGLENVRYKKILIVLGTQSDEIFSRYDNINDTFIRTKFFSMLSVYLALFLSSIIIITKFGKMLTEDMRKNSERREVDWKEMVRRFLKP